MSPSNLMPLSGSCTMPSVWCLYFIPGVRMTLVLLKWERLLLSIRWRTISDCRLCWVAWPGIDLLGLFLSFEVRRFLVVLVSMSVFYLLFHLMHLSDNVWEKKKKKTAGELFRNMDFLPSPTIIHALPLSHEVRERLSGGTNCFIQLLEQNQK